MRDPEMVSRAHRAAITLERAWERWRIMHGLSAAPMPPVSSYVGYSTEEPWGRPRVVFGVDAHEAELLAALLDRHECVGPFYQAGSTGEIMDRPAWEREQDQLPGQARGGAPERVQVPAPAGALRPAPAGSGPWEQAPAPEQLQPPAQDRVPAPARPFDQALASDQAEVPDAAAAPGGTQAVPQGWAPEEPEPPGRDNPQQAQLPVRALLPGRGEAGGAGREYASVPGVAGVRAPARAATEAPDQESSRRDRAAPPDPGDRAIGDRVRPGRGRDGRRASGGSGASGRAGRHFQGSKPAALAGAAASQVTSADVTAPAIRADPASPVTAAAPLDMPAPTEQVRPAGAAAVPVAPADMATPAALADLPAPATLGDLASAASPAGHHSGVDGPAEAVPPYGVAELDEPLAYEPPARDEAGGPAGAGAGVSTIAAELAGWASGELPGQASARLAAWEAIGGVPAAASHRSKSQSGIGAAERVG